MPSESFMIIPYTKNMENMSDSTLYLSICIPTYDRLSILKKTLTSIYADLSDVNIDEFEVVISDNSPNQSTKVILEEFSYSNLKYIVADCEGFLNSFNALKNAKGLFLKLHNNYTILRPGTLKKMLEYVKSNLNDKPLIYFTNGLGLSFNVKTLYTFNDFMFHLSYFSSWSTGFSTWKEDFDNFDSLHIDRMFPQTSVLLSQDYKQKYIINDLPIFENQDIPKKGGYNIFKVFLEDYVLLINKSLDKSSMSIATFNKIKKDLLYDYVSSRYFKTVVLRIDNFEKTGIKSSTLKHYNLKEYYLMILFSFFTPFRVLFRKLKCSLRYP